MNVASIALSIRQPWAWLILNAGKDIENRTWRTSFRGRVLIHAAKGMTLNEYDDAAETLEMINPKLKLPMKHELERGGIVGEMEIVNCVDHSDSPWFFGRWGFVLRNVQALTFQECKGELGFFTVQFPADAVPRPRLSANQGIFPSGNTKE